MAEREILIISKKQYKKRQKIWHKHQAKMDILLKAHSLKEVPVAKDGNCFFRAVAAHLGSTWQIVKEQLITYIAEKRNDPIIRHYFNGTDIDLELQKLENSSTWNLSTSDVLPLAAANLYDKSVRILTSNANYNDPVIIITTDQKTDVPTEWMTLCYYSIPGEEHYNAAVDVS